MQLISFLSLLAERSEARLNGAAPPRPAFLQMLVDQRNQVVPPIPVVRRFDEEIEGKILVAPNLLTDEAHLIAEAERLGLSTVPVSSQSSCVFLTLDRVRIRGIDFDLFDRLWPPSSYP